MIPHMAAGGTLAAPVRGALWMTAASVAFAAMIGLLRVAMTSLHPFEVAFFRNLFGMLAMAPWLAHVGFGAMRTRRLNLHILRAGVGLIAMLCWFMAVWLMPLAEAVALSFTAPLFATVGAALVLHEVVRGRRWTATVVGFIGVLVILRPGVEAVSPAALLVLASAATGAISALMVKSLAKTESPNAIVLYMTVFLTPISLVPALFVWQTPDWMTLAVLACIGVLGTIGHMCFARAMKAADASAVIPFDYVRLPLVAIVGYVAFGESLDGWAWVGAAIIIGATLYIARREAVVARERRPHDPGPIAPPASKEKL